ncbi:alpha/beta hydrolase [Photobacterium nomapromontoriensis]|uniref:alpha/beta hydrolase n=1 Tax=Photobacterium nomapromontoriensis TaxID=2910237 RepID=UPI003D1217A9
MRHFDPQIKNYDPNRMVIINNFSIPQLNRYRTVRIYLPVDYKDSHHTYPVIYMHDGQNVFEPSLCIAGMSWQAGEQLDDLQHNSAFTGAIIVAIDCSPERGYIGRRDEYSPWPYAPIMALSSWPDAQIPQGGEGHQYCQFLVDTLKPYIDAHYRTKPQREHTIITGSSMGGLISLYAAIRYPSVFSKAGVFSPAFWFARQPMINFIAAADINLPLEIYMDIGTNETSDPDNPEFPALYHDFAVELAEQLQHCSPLLQCELLIDHGGIHSESAWAMRFPNMLKQFFMSSVLA